jgi:predicted SAM-dependent methyltransferase
MDRQYVQFGCGMCAPESWLNFDAGPAFWLQSRFPFLTPLLVKRGFPEYPKNIRYGDVIKGLPISPQSTDAVYCSHVLEHMTLEEFRVAIRNVFNYLRPGGTFRLVLPDLEQLIRSYVDDPSSEASSRFMRQSYLGEASLARGLKAMPTALFGRSRHLWMWDYKGMAEQLAEAGFTDIRRAQIGDSPDPHFSEVESEGRWTDCLGVECKRPEL